VLIEGQRWVEAMCAIDALGIAPMLGLPVEIHSHDPVNAGEVWVRLDPREGAWWEPEVAVVPSGSACCEGPSFRGCCDVLNFFETRANAERYLAENASVSGRPISLPEAIEAGRIVFGDVFTEGE
jgi:Alkylmercury lyase